MPPKAPPARLTHFLCIPLVTTQSRPQLQISLHKFREDITGLDTSQALNNIELIPEIAIRPLGTLHLTLGIMSLLTQERIDKALGILQHLDLKEMLNQVSGSQELNISLKGLSAMRAPEKTSVLYAPPVDEDQKLQRFCQKLGAVFMEAGFLVNESRPLLLHATIVNSVYVTGTKGRGGHRRKRTKLMFDARDVIERYQDYQWMSDVKAEKIAVCQMGARKLENGDEEYVVEGEVRMP